MMIIARFPPDAARILQGESSLLVRVPCHIPRNMRKLARVESKKINELSEYLPDEASAAVLILSPRAQFQLHPKLST